MLLDERVERVQGSLSTVIWPDC